MFDFWFWVVSHKNDFVYNEAREQPANNALSFRESAWFADFVFYIVLSSLFLFYRFYLT